METLASITQWDLPAPPVVYTSPLATGSSGTIVTSASPSPTYSTKTGIVSNSLDDFFANVFSAFDVFAQLLNIIYLHTPQPEDWISFDRIVNLLPNPPLNRDSAKILLEGCQRASLNKQANLYRNCSTHRTVLQFKVVAEIEPFNADPSLNVVAILLPDDPEANVATYRELIEARKFSERVLRHALSVIDRAYGIMNQTIGHVDGIPVI